MIRLAVMGMVMLMPQVAVADLIARPQSCMRIATSQYDNCEVSNLFRCSDAGLLPYRVEDTGQGGVRSVSTLDADYNIIEVLEGHVDSGATMRVTGPSLAEVIETGQGAQDMVGELRMFGMRQPVTGAGTAAYEGESVEWAGIVFHRIASDSYIDMPPPMGRMTGGGTVLYNTHLDLSLDEIVWTNGLGQQTRKQLQALALPGQPGFGLEVPGFGCQHVSGLERPNEGAVL